MEAQPLIAFDRVVELDGAGIRTLKAVSVAEPCFAGHYPDQPIYPGVFTLEGFHQSVAAYVARRHPGRRARLAELRSLRLHLAVAPGALLTFDCRCVVEGDRLSVKAECRSRDREIVAEAALRYVLEGS